jgi:hypothetical protein
MRLGRYFLTIACVLLVSSAASATPITVLVGDKDGFGAGCAVPGSCPSVTTSPVVDNRSAAEAAAVNGAQITDVFSSVFLGFGPNPNVANVIFPFVGTLTSAAITFAGADFQSDVFGALGANVNGVATPFFFPDGRFVTALHAIVLSPAMLAAANLLGSVNLNLNRSTSGDFISFDYFELNGDTTTVPEPGTMILLGMGLAGGALRLRRRHSA